MNGLKEDELIGLDNKSEFTAVVVAQRGSGGIIVLCDDNEFDCISMDGTMGEDADDWREWEEVGNRGMYGEGCDEKEREGKREGEDTADTSHAEDVTHGDPMRSDDRNIEFSGVFSSWIWKLIGGFSLTTFRIFLHSSTEFTPSIFS
jgi:hypothetical protein